MIDNRISILQLIAPTQFGGAEGTILSLADAIDKEHFQLFCGSFVNVHFPNNPFVQEIRKRNIPNKTLWLKRMFDVSNLFAIIALIKKNHIDIVHTHGYRSDIIGLLAARTTGKPIVATIHGWVPINRRLRLYQKADEMALRYFNRLIPVSDEIQNGLLEKGVNANIITRLHNAVAVTDFPGLAKTAQSFNESFLGREATVGVIGRLSPEKDIPTFLKAAALLKPRFPHLKFLVVGDGPEKRTLQSLAGDLGLSDRLTFTGFVQDIDTVYQQLDLLVISSLTEGIPLVVLEAMKHSIPVVSTRVGGMKEVIEDGLDGMLVEPNNPEMLATSIEALLLDADKYTRTAGYARKKIVERFNVNHWVQAIEAIYRNLMRSQQGKLQ